MTKAIIYCRCKSSMQSGLARAGKWVLEFESDNAQKPNPLIGWNGSSGTLSQLRLEFATQQEAIAHAKRAGLDFTIALEHARRIRPKSYAANFSKTRPEPWTH